MTADGLMTAWFGTSWGAPFNVVALQIAVPVGETCLWCEEPIAAEDSGVRMPYLSDGPPRAVYQHVECFVRSLLGSVGHQLQLCPCFGGDETCEPETMTRRESARAACELAQSRARDQSGDR